jgi:small-conductance mechanosensitive channel
VLALWVALAGPPSARAAADTPVPATPAPSPTRAAPVPLAEIAKRSDELDVYLKQLAQRLAPGDQLQTFDSELSAMGERINMLRPHTTDMIDAGPALREVDDMIAHWRGFQDTLSDWNATLTTRVTQLEQEIRGLTELRAIWLATRDEAQAAAAPTAMLDRIKVALSLVQQTRKQVESYRETLLALQDRTVQQSAQCRDAIDALSAYRSAAVGRLLVRDGQPIWAPERWEAGWEAVRTTPERPELAHALEFGGEYLRLQLPRVPLQVVLFFGLLALWRRARRRTAAADDGSLAPVAAVFQHPVSSALFLTLLATPWIYPGLPLLLQRAVRIAAVVPLLRVLGGLVEPPILPGLFTLGALFVIDQVRNLAAPAVEELLFLLEVVVAILVLAWMLRSGRIARLRTDLPPRIVPLLERAARVVLGLFAFVLVADSLGFIQLARVVADAVLLSGYAAMLLFAMQRFAQGVWAYVLRTRLLRRAHMVQRHRDLLQERGERLLSWIAAALWVVAALKSAELFDSLSDGLHSVLTATLRVGSFSVSLGDVLAFAVTIWLSFLVSRFARFVLAEDVYPRVRLRRGMPYALSTMLHYVILLLGFWVALSAAGINLDRFALLAGAFGVGVGIGMQNIVNNFISGLILLFERPVQVGDTVQIGELSGEVRRIGIRSSTVRTGDGAEVIVPNASLIANPVTNWALSDRMRRIDLAVRVAYDSDPEQVIEILRSVAVTHPLVMETPAPVALFVGFGDSALSFELRAWTDRFEQWGTIRSELALAVIKSFGEAGIRIPMPQHDVRVDTAQPVPVRVVDPNGRKDS